MKTKFFGFGAKVALAVLAVCGTVLTSCYEKDSVDPVTPIPDAAYYVTGSVTDATNGQPIQTANVQIDGKDVTLSNGAFYEKVSEGAHTVAVTADGYYDLTKTVYCAKVEAGQTSVAVADVALFTPDALVTKPVTEPTTPELGTSEKETLAGLFAPEASEGATLGAAQVARVNDDYVITYPATFNEPATSKVVTYAYNEGFDLLAKPALTKAPTFEEQFIANAANAIGKSYGLKKVQKSTSLIAGDKESITGYTLTYVVSVKDYVFAINGANYKAAATWQTQATVKAVIKSDSHDSHDSHDGHGGNSNAGGGAADAE